MGLNLTNPLIQQLHVRFFESQLHSESVLQDPFTILSGVYYPDKRMPIPDATMLMLNKMVPRGTRNARLPLQENLSGAPQEGTATNPVGLEEDLTQKYVDAYYNDVSHVVALQEYGIEAETKNYYQIFEEITPKEAIYQKELKGKYIRESYVERYSSNLTAAPLNLTQGFNPNIAVCGLAPASWPVWNQTAATWVNNIGTALAAAGTGTAAACTLRFLQAVEERVTTGIVGDRNQIIEPINYKGKEGYICVLPSPQYRWMMDAIQANGIGTVYRDVSAHGDKDMSYPNMFINVGKLFICEDPRYPTITLGGSTDNYSLTVAYRLYGNNGATSDPRDQTTNSRQVGFVLGKAGCMEWMPEKYHWEYGYERYDKFGGKGVFFSGGWTRVDWDYAAANVTATSMYNNSSALMIFAQPPAVT